MRVFALATAVTGIALAAPGAGFAAAPVPPDPAIMQYVEQVPTSGGSQLAGVGSGHVKLSTKVTRRIDAAGSYAGALTAVATATAYGAPPAHNVTTRKTRSAGTSGHATRTGPRSEPALAAAPVVVRGGAGTGSDAPLVLGAILAAGLAVAGAARLGRGHRGPRSGSSA